MKAPFSALLLGAAVVVWSAGAAAEEPEERCQTRCTDRATTTIKECLTDCPRPDSSARATDTSCMQGCATRMSAQVERCTGECPKQQSKTPEGHKASEPGKPDRDSRFERLQCAP